MKKLCNFIHLMLIWALSKCFSTTLCARRGSLVPWSDSRIPKSGSRKSRFDCTFSFLARIFVVFYHFPLLYYIDVWGFLFHVRRVRLQKHQMCSVCEAKQVVYKKTSFCYSMFNRIASIVQYKWLLNKFWLEDRWHF